MLRPLLLLLAMNPSGTPPTPARSEERELMVQTQIASRGVRDEGVLRALRRVPRHEFVPQEHAALAYADQPLPIGHNQTISQPYIVALMTEAIGLRGGERVLEIGTGSGYQAAVLAELVKEVLSIEIVVPLADQARARLKRLGYANVSVRAGDGYAGWPERGPFDAIMLTAAAPRIPAPLLDQLTEGGRLIAPVGDDVQELLLVTRRGGRFVEQRLAGVRFVPMTGKVRE